jgi:hypothetical protein
MAVTRTGLTALASLGILALAFVPLERAFPARAGQRTLRPGLWLDGLFFAGQYLVWNGLSVGLLHAAASAPSAATHPLGLPLPTPRTRTPLGLLVAPLVRGGLQRTTATPRKLGAPETGA